MADFLQSVTCERLVCSDFPLISDRNPVLLGGRQQGWYSRFGCADKSLLHSFTSGGREPSLPNADDVSWVALFR